MRAELDKNKIKADFHQALEQQSMENNPAVVAVLIEQVKGTVNYSVVAHASDFDLLVAAAAALQAIVERGAHLQLVVPLAFLTEEITQELAAKQQRKKELN